MKMKEVLVFDTLFVCISSCDISLISKVQKRKSISEWRGVGRDGKLQIKLKSL